MLLSFQLIPHKILQRLALHRRGQLPLPDLFDVAIHVIFHGLEGYAAEDIEKAGEGFAGFEEFRGRDGGGGLVDGDLVEGPFGRVEIGAAGWEGHDGL